MTVSVVEWICDCCGNYLTQSEDRFIVRATVGAIEDRCEDCAGHVVHCHEFILCDCHPQEAGQQP